MSGVVIWALICFAIPAFLFFKLHFERKNVQEYLARILGIHNDMENSLLLGLHNLYRHRSTEELEAEEKKNGPIKFKNPWDFEYFISDIMEEIYIGKGYVSPGSGDQGVDIEIDSDAGKYLGQVKCYDPNSTLSYEPIALIHSRMVKDRAKYGFVATTARFSEAAIKYAEHLRYQGYHIELIDGPKLVRYWAQAITAKKLNYSPDFNVEPV